MVLFGQLKSRQSWFESALILLSSTLLGIWAIKDTIALRNILLVVGVIFSLIYLWRLYQRGLLDNIRLYNWLPFLLMALLFIWVIAHYFILSRYPEVQLQELKSTWFRAFLAMVLGMATGFALHKKINSINLLWLGIGLSFTYLFCQYLSRAILEKNIFVVDWYGGYYIYIGKINGVLMGSLLFCGLGAAWIDHLRVSGFVIRFSNTFLPLIGMVLTLYAYVFIFDTRNGVGIAVLCVIGWALYGFFWFLGQANWQQLLQKFKGAILLTILAVTILAAFTYQQTRFNTGWSTMIEDVKIAAQIEKYPNWQNPGRYGYPMAESGKAVAGNTYERVAWGIAGIHLIPANPFGIGVLNQPFNRLLQEKFPGATPGSTHSAWIELALAFGLPGLIFLFGALVCILVLTIISPSPQFGGCIVSLSLMLMLLYAIGELSRGHAIEVLFFVMALLAALRIPFGVNDDSFPSRDRVFK